LKVTFLTFDQSLSVFLAQIGDRVTDLSKNLFNKAFLRRH